MHTPEILQGEGLCLRDERLAMTREEKSRFTYFFAVFTLL